MNNKIKDILLYLTLLIIDFIFVSFVICKIDRLLYYSKFAAITASIISSVSVGIVAILDKKYKFFS